MVIIMFPDFTTQIIEESNKCCFSTCISDEMTCCKDGDFDFNGFPVSRCKHYPCNRIIDLNKKFGIDILKRKDYGKTIGRRRKKDNI